MLCPALESTEAADGDGERHQSREKLIADILLDSKVCQTYLFVMLEYQFYTAAADAFATTRRHKAHIYSTVTNATPATNTAAAAAAAAATPAITTNKTTMLLLLLQLLCCF
jgi:zona occludens toxin (predicted ATPase)